MHFSEIAAEIKKSNFKRKNVTIQAIHNELIKDAKDREEEMEQLLVNEIASLYVPAEQIQRCIFKMKHTGQEYTINQTDAPREVVLKVVETVCGDILCHQEGYPKKFNV